LSKTVYNEQAAFSNISSEDAAHILHYLEEKGMISIDDVQEDMNKKKQEKFLSQHKYKIFEGKDGRWRTTVPDNSKKSGRRLIAKTRYEDLVNEVVEFYSKQEESTRIENWTLRKLYPEWLQLKQIHSDTTSYIKRIHADWKKFYLNNEISDIPVKDLTRLYLDKWLHNIIKEYNMTKKEYYRMSIILRGCLDFACEDGINIIEINPMKSISINSKLFQKEKKPDRKKEVWLEDELEKLINTAWKKYEKNPSCITPLMILLNMQLGLRVGELVTLKSTDIEGKSIHIQRMEQAEYEIEGIEKSAVRSGFKVVDRTKTDFSERLVPMNSEAQRIFKLIVETNKKYGRHDEDYIFLSSHSGKRAKAQALQNYLRSLCDSASLSRKSNHKIRKTVLSNMIQNGINIDTVRRFAGHVDERTTLQSYCFDTTNELELERKLEMCKLV
jgi:integrase